MIRPGETAQRQPTTNPSPPAATKPVWPFVLMVLAPLLLEKFVGVLTADFRFSWWRDAGFYLYWLYVFAGGVVIVAGAAGMIFREVGNARLRRQQPGLPTAPAWPYALMAALTPPALMAWSVAEEFHLFDLPHRWEVAGNVHLLFVDAPVSAVLVAVGIACAIIRAKTNSTLRAPRAEYPRAPMGYTTEGQPIYPVVGYTPDGAPVTADRAVGLAPAASGTNAMAITALVCAFFAPLLAVIFGHIARSQIRRTGEGGAGMALAGLILGYLALAASLIAGIAFAVFVFAAGQGAF